MTKQAKEAMPVDLPSVNRRRLIAVGVVVFLLSQTLIPASYYFADEPTSERFAWRMFSSVDLSSWDTHVFAKWEKQGKVIEQEVPVSASLQETYVKTVQRAQFDIVEAYMRKLCEQDGMLEVRYEAQGKLPSGKLMAPIRLSMKPGGKLVKLPD